jgi:hypothetical protein
MHEEQQKKLYNMKGLSRKSIYSNQFHQLSDAVCPKCRDGGCEDARSGRLRRPGPFPYSVPNDWWLSFWE